MDGLPICGVIWLIGLMILNAVVEAMVTAFESVSESAVERRLEEGDTKAKRVQYLLKHHRRYITVTDLLRLMAVSGMAVVYYVYFLPYFKEILWKAFGKVVPDILLMAVLVLITFLVLMLVELFAIKLPKNYRKFAYEDKQTAAQMEEETEYDSDYDYDEEFWEEADDI